MIIKKYQIVLILVLFAARSIHAESIKTTVTIPDLVGHWGFGHSLMLNYLDHGNGNYSHSGNIYGMKYSVKPDGTFYYAFAARLGTKTIRETGLGRVILSPGFITFKFDKGAAEKYKFISLTTGAGPATLSLVQATDPAQKLKCGHSRGYFDCTGAQAWILRPVN